MGRWTAIVMIGGLAMVGCETEPAADSQRQDEEPRFAEIQPRGAEEGDEPDEEIGPPEVSFTLWPGGADWAASELMWLGSGEVVELREEPYFDAAIIGEGRWEDGEFLEWSTSIIRVDQPRPYGVDDGVEILGTVYDIEFGELEAQDEIYRLEPGDEVWLYQYAGDGMCYLLIGDEVVLGDCPGEELSAIDTSGLEEGDGLKPISESWWVEVEADGAQGWLFVHDTPVEVHSRKSEGMRDLDDQPEFERFPGEVEDF